MRQQINNQEQIRRGNAEGSVNQDENGVGLRRREGVARAKSRANAIALFFKGFLVIAFGQVFVWFFRLGGPVFARPPRNRQPDEALHDIS